MWNPTFEMLNRYLVAPAMDDEAKSRPQLLEELNSLRAALASLRAFGGVENPLHPQSTSFFRIAFDTSPVGMALVSDTGRFLQVNPSLSYFLGYTAEELLRLRLADITHPPDREMVNAAVSKVAAA